MKKVVCAFAVLFCVVALMQVASALSSNLKQTYLPSETAIGKISGSVLEPISERQIKVKRGNQDVGVEYGLKKIGGNYFVWFISPVTKENYTFIIEDVITTVNGVPKVMDYVHEFKVDGEI